MTTVTIAVRLDDATEVATIHLENVTDTAGLVRAIDRVAQPYANGSQEVQF